MKKLSLSEVRRQLLLLDAGTKIHLFISTDCCKHSIYDYICTAVDAVVILPLFGEVYSYNYKIISQ